MNNQKLSRLLSPNLQLYFICLVIFTLATIPVSPMLAAAEGAGPVLFKIALLHFLLPGVMAFAIAWFMRKKGWIQDGDMKLDM